MIVRLLLVVAALGAVWLLIAGLERMRGASSTVGLAGGLTLVTGIDCRLCDLAVAAVDGADVPVHIVDVADLGDHSVKAVPTAIVTDRDGAVVARRSGRAAISGMPAMIEAARAAN